MTIGVGGKSIEEALATLAVLSDMTQGVLPIARDEYLQRITRAQTAMREQSIAAMWVHAGSNMTYFSGTKWGPSERMVGAIIPATGAIEYIAPYFEQNTLRDYMVIEGNVNVWHEHESPYQLFVSTLKRMGIAGDKDMPPRIGVSEDAPYFVVDGIAQLAMGFQFINAKPVTAHCRSRKSAGEIALMQRAKNMTLEVHKAAASILCEGITTTEVTAFINDAHKKIGAPGSYFCIVLFGEATAFPHGVKNPQILKQNDIVLIDTGCQVEGYISDITRTYVFGEANTRQRAVWNAEKTAQAAAFNAAQLGVPCKEVDAAARRSLEASGFGPGYKLPGLPHRTGHGIGLDIHEWPYLVGSDDTPLAEGMCFSNEPMICVPGEFGIRLEDHFYMTSTGPKWFTAPSHSVDDPFGLRA
ncbi:MAG: aminopeptidase P family protein [Betaproteobacteria bacterium]|nr:aminopeptidase P family protein [Betaproteobacteria bacterium]